MSLSRLADRRSRAAPVTFPTVEAVDALPPEQLRAFLTAATTLAAHAAARLATYRDDAPTPAPAGGPLITVREAAERLRKSPAWIYRHGKRLPFVRRIGTRALNIDAGALEHWLANRTP